MEKQIEEMFFDVVKAFNHARDFCVDQGGCDICENRKYGKNCDFASMAEHLYKEGYRKQIEGEWKLIQDGKGVCSVCNRQDAIDSLAHFCRYCGAHMRGGAE